MEQEPIIGHIGHDSIVESPKEHLSEVKDTYGDFASIPPQIMDELKVEFGSEEELNKAIEVMEEEHQGLDAV